MNAVIRMININSVIRMVTLNTQEINLATDEFLSQYLKLRINIVATDFNPHFGSCIYTKSYA